MGEGPLSHIFCGGTALENEPLGFYGRKALAVLRGKGANHDSISLTIISTQIWTENKAQREIPQNVALLTSQGYDCGSFPCFYTFLFC